jgi:ABC-type amino acid transport substrate-binding protein
MVRQLFVLCLLIVATCLPAQTDALHDTTILRVAVADLPTYCIKDQRGDNWHGMAMELWRQVAEREQWRYELVEYETRHSLLSALNNNEVDVVITALLDAETESEVEFMQSYHRTTLGLALPMSSGLWSIVKGIFTLQFLYVVLALCSLLLLVGVLVYYMERKDNEEQFGGDRTTWQGIGSGFWWAGVTMTTIGYGDKAPQTLGGRTIAMLWMLVAMAVTSGLTATVIAATSARTVVDFPNDLTDMKVGVLVNSPAAEYLDQQGTDYVTFADYTEGLQSFQDGEIDAVVADATTLEYEIGRNSNLLAYIQTTDADPEAYAFAVREGSPLTEPLQKAVIQVTLTEMWREIVNGYKTSDNPLQ